MDDHTISYQAVRNRHVGTDGAVAADAHAGSDCGACVDDRARSDLGPRTDDGAGIPPAERERVFERFHRARRDVDGER